MSTGAPIIGLTGRRKPTGQIAGFPDSFERIEADVFVADYADSIDAAGGLALLLPQSITKHHRAEDVVARLDGLVVTGGADLQPALYGAEAETDLYPPEPARDDTESALVRAALAANVPVLGICRGLQLLNVLGGGTLHQHVPEHARYDLAPDAGAHGVTLEAGSVLAACFGEQVEVNSMHHQTVDRVAPGWTVTARADDGTIEGLERPGRPVVAVQWHPEAMPDRSGRLFRWLVDQAADQAREGSARG